MATTILDSERLEEALEALVKAGNYPSKQAAMLHALEVLLLANPSLRLKTAIELYRADVVTLARAAEIAGISPEAFKEALAQAGVERVIDAPIEEIRKGAQKILRGHS